MVRLLAVRIVVSIVVRTACVLTSSWTSSKTEQQTAKNRLSASSVSTMTAVIINIQLNEFSVAFEFSSAKGMSCMPPSPVI